MRRITSFFVCLFFSTSASAVVVPDNGSGTGHMPVHAAYNQEAPMLIVDGLPPSTTMELYGVLTAPASTIEAPGGTLGGTSGTSSGSSFAWSLQGTGSLSGFNRLVNLPLSNLEVHSAPRMLAAPVQTFNTKLWGLQGQITGDPDFDLLRITAGDAFGMPSPGQTTFTQSGSNWAVDSFFDVTYRIDFICKPGGPLGGMSGSTTRTVRISIPEPMTAAIFLPAMLVWRRRTK